MNAFIDIMTIICIVIVFFIFGFSYGWKQCEKTKATQSKDESNDHDLES